MTTESKMYRPDLERVVTAHFNNKLIPWVNTEIARSNYGSSSCNAAWRKRTNADQPKYLIELCDKHMHSSDSDIANMREEDR